MERCYTYELFRSILVRQQENWLHKLILTRFHRRLDAGNVGRELQCLEAHGRAAERCTPMEGPELERMGASQRRATGGGQRGG
jgi:hypothetical protein